MLLPPIMRYVNCFFAIFEKFFTFYESSLAFVCLSK